MVVIMNKVEFEAKELRNATVVEAYLSTDKNFNATMEMLKDNANTLNISKACVRGVLMSKQIYIKMEKVEKVKVVTATKMELVEDIATALNITFADIESLLKANKVALETVIDAVLKPIEEAPEA